MHQASSTQQTVQAELRYQTRPCHSSRQVGFSAKFSPSGVPRTAWISLILPGSASGFWRLGVPVEGCVVDTATAGNNAAFI